MLPAGSYLTDRSNSVSERSIQRGGPRSLSVLESRVTCRVCSSPNCDARAAREGAVAGFLIYSCGGELCVTCWTRSGVMMPESSATSISGSALQ